MKLSLCVPHYKETDEQVKPLLDSIALQQGIDFSVIEVVIAHDGEEAAPLSKCLEDKPYKIKEITSAHGGVCKARNAALDASSGEYVMFCDCDDMFSNALGVFYILREIGKEFNMLTSAFVEEAIVSRERLGFVNRQFDEVFVHGKVFRRAFLDENDIRFNEELTLHEDHNFTFLCRELAGKDKYRYCPTRFIFGSIALIRLPANRTTSLWRRGTNF